MVIIAVILSVQTTQTERFGISFAIIDQYSDLYLLDSTGYRYCIYHTDQSEMNVLATKDDILQSFTYLSESGASLNKTIYTIELKITSIKVVVYEDMGYSYLCDNKLSEDRKYCYNMVHDLFDKARLRITEGAAGIYVKDVNFDDVNGTCGCITPNDPDPTYRGLKTIAEASQENVNDLSYYDCTKGNFPVIQN